MKAADNQIELSFNQPVNTRRKKTIQGAELLFKIAYLLCSLPSESVINRGTEKRRLWNFAA